MAKRKKNKKAGKQNKKKVRAKDTKQLTGKEPTAHKPTDDKADAKARIESPSDIEHLWKKTDGTQTYTPAVDAIEVNIGKSETEIPTGNVEDSQKDNQKDGGITEAIIETATEEERPANDVRNLQTEEQARSATGIVAEEPNIVENLSENAGNTQADNPVDDMAESVVECYVTSQSKTEKADDFKANKQADDSTDLDSDISDTEINERKADVPQTDGQIDEITEAILDAAAETERLDEDAESLQTEDKQKDTIIEAEDFDVAESSGQTEADTQADKSVDDISESIVEESVAAESLTEKIDDAKRDDQTGNVNETLIEEPDAIEKRIEKADDTQTESLVGEVIEVDTETERFTEEVEDLYTDDEQTDIVVEVKDYDTAESLNQDTENTQADKSVDDVPEFIVEESVAAANLTEKIDDAKIDDQSDEAIEDVAVADETVIADSSVEIQTVVDRIKKLILRIFRIGSKTDDSTEDGIGSPETVAIHTRKADDTRKTSEELFTTETNVEGEDEKIQKDVFSDNKLYRTNKTGVIVSVFIMIAAIILLIVASVERRSAKKTLVQINKVAESLKQMQEEALKDREQVTHSQIESKELVIDALSLTRNALELERANSDEVEVKKIIGVFINDINERIAKIKGDIVLLRNKLKDID